jgi:L-ribulokinase
VAKKSPLVMQIVADVLNKPIKVARSEQAVALGSAMAAAVVAGVHPSIPEAQKAMGGGFETEYHPEPEMVRVYEKLYEQYKRFGQFVEGETTLN